MAVYRSEFVTDIAKPFAVRPIAHQMAAGDADAYEFTVLVADSRAPETGLMAGSVSGAVVRPDGGTVVITGEKGTDVRTVQLPEGECNATPCTITIPQAALAYPGRVVIVIRLLNDTVETTVLAASATVARTLTGTVIDPGEAVPDITALLAQIQACKDATDAAEAVSETTLGNFAPEFDAAEAKAAGAFVTYAEDGKLYLLPEGHTAGTSWANTTHTETDFGAEVSSLKSQTSTEAFDVAEAAVWEQGTINVGVDGASTTRIRTVGYIPISNLGQIFANIQSGYKYELDFYDKNKAYLTATGWLTTPYRLDLIQSDKAFLRLLLAKTDNTTASTSWSSNLTVTGTSMISGTMNALAPAPCMDEPVHVIPLTFSDGSIDDYGRDYNHPTYTGAKRKRSPIVPIDPGRPLHLDIPTTYQSWLYFYNRSGEMVSQSDGYAWHSFNEKIQVPTGAVAFRVLLRMSSNTDVPDWVCNATCAFQLYNDTDDAEFTPAFDIGAVNDTSGYNGAISNTNNTVRLHSHIISVRGGNLYLNIPSGYLIDVYEFEKDLAFLGERYWLDGKIYMHVRSGAEYARILVKRSDGGEVSSTDIAAMANMKIRVVADAGPKQVNPALATTQIVGHRGGDSDAPENTIPSIEAAIQKGVKIVEVDLNFTSDGVCVLLHDNTIDRTSDGSGNIYDMTYAQVSTYDFGSWFSAEFAGTKIPTLREALIAAKKGGAVLYLDFATSEKTTRFTQSNLETIINTVKACGMASSVIMECLEEPARKLLYLSPDFSIMLSVNSTSDVEKYAYLVPGAARFIGTRNYLSGVTDALVDACHNAGMLFQAWNIPGEAGAEECRDLGADLIMYQTLP